jgi:hypothetical protein
MPLLGLHMTVARELAPGLRSSAVDGERGAYYLGATTPDIRALTRWDRERTHFFRLDEFGDQSGVHRLFEEQPALREASALDARTVAFMAGYISHLILDEAYITTIYRPFFGAGSARADDLMANVMDRLLLYHLDKQERANGPAIEEIRTALTETSADVAVDFIARDALQQWRNVQIEVIGRPPSFAKMLTRQLAGAGIEGDDAVSQFMEQHADELLHDTIEHIGENRIRGYLCDSKERARRAMKDYLS